jgi:hypothetical protein
VPEYFSSNRFQAIEERTRILVDHRRTQSNESATTAFSTDLCLPIDNDTTCSMTQAAAVRLLQAHERARQGRVHAYSMYRMKHDSTPMNMISNDETALDDACLIIQTVWRQVYAEKLFNRKKRAECQLLGMVRRMIGVS